VQIERIAIGLRRRSAWEAIDLGGSAWRAWAPAAWRIWAACYGSVGLLLLAILWEHQEIALLILWWLKPAFDRILLFTFSRSLFHQTTRLRDVLGALPSLARHSGLLAGLTLRRASMARSLLLPVWQLEGLRGKAARERCKVLSRRCRGQAVWLTLVCAHFSVVLSLSLFLLISALIPEGIGDSLSLANWFRNNLTPGQEFVLSLLTLLAETVVEPLYVASGFALYLNRRSELEGWDIELAFRRLAGRALATAASLLLVAGLTAGLLLSPGDAQADEVPTTPALSHEKQVITAIVADPVFGQQTKAMKWRWEETPTPADTETPAWLRFLQRIVEFFSQTLTALAWVAGLLLAVAFIYLLVVHHERWLGSRRPPSRQPDFLFGLDVRPASLPADLVGAARAAIAEGRFEFALSLLYRGALVALIQSTRIEFRPGDTEENCRQRVGGHLEAAASGYFGELIDAWRRTAYAHQPPDAPVLETLCQGWESHFGRPNPGRPS